jgi:hypothetical protein
MQNNTWEKTAGKPLNYPTSRGSVGETELGGRAYVAGDDAETIGQRLFDADKFEQKNG